CSVLLMLASVVIRAISSFPTRRSSDLCSKEYLTQILKDELGCPGYVRSDWGGIKKIKERHKLARTDEQAICMALNNGLDVQGIEDRKSTRLNSSHVSISYAVFCLKKQN